MPPQPSSEQDSDDELLRRTALGDAFAFAALFRRRHARVYRFALHMTGTAAAAEDVTQDVFMVVMREAVRYEPNRSGVTAWLCGVARNCARRRLERDRQFQPLDEEHEPAMEPAAQTDPLGDLTRAESIEAVRRAVLSLPVRYREVVALCDLQELSYAQAADALRCAVGTVRSRLHRGRAMLAVKLSGSASSLGGLPGCGTMPAPSEECRGSVGRHSPDRVAAEGQMLKATPQHRPGSLRGTRSCA